MYKIDGHELAEIAFQLWNISSKCFDLSEVLLKEIEKY